MVQQLNSEVRKQISEFLASVAGEAYVAKLDLLVSVQHELAEETLEHSAYYTSKASGLRHAKSELVAMGQEVIAK